jgi:hypothetical protein
MAESLSAEQVRETYVGDMRPEFGAVYYAL